MAIGTIKKMYLKQQKNIKQEKSLIGVAEVHTRLQEKMVGLMK